MKTNIRNSSVPSPSQELAHQSQAQKAWKGGDSAKLCRDVLSAPLGFGSCAIVCQGDIRAGNVAFLESLGGKSTCVGRSVKSIVVCCTFPLE